MISAIVLFTLMGAIGAGIASLMKNDTLGSVFGLTGVLLSALWLDCFYIMAIPGSQTVYRSWIGVGGLVTGRWRYPDRRHGHCCDNGFRHGSCLFRWLYVP